MTSLGPAPASTTAPSAPGQLASSERAAFAVRNVRAVLPDRVLDDAVVVCEQGRIAAVESGRAVPPAAIDGRRALLVPGIIDVHSDALECEVNPRPGALFPIGFALAAFEGRVRAAGVTTVFHGVRFQDNPGYDRTLEHARAVVAALRKRAAVNSPVDHRVLHRMDVRSPVALDVLVECLPDEPEALVSLEDHTPGQGQFRDLERFVAARTRERHGRTHDQATELVRERIAARQALLPHVGRNRERLAALGARRRVRLVAHDVESADELARVHAAGFSVAEFPVTLGAARAARERGMPVVMGAPNVIRRGSHSGNVSAREVIQADLCTALASDYSPPTLLAAALALAGEGVLPLPAAVALVTFGPATAAGLSDRGTLVPGARHDLLLVDDSGHWPRVRLVLPLP